MNMPLPLFQFMREIHGVPDRVMNLIDNFSREMECAALF